MSNQRSADLDSFLKLLENGDRGSAVRLVIDRHSAGMSVRDIVVDLLGPAQETVGERWKIAGWSVAMEHAASAIVDAALGAIAVDRIETNRDLSLVMACPGYEWHSLPRRMAAEVLREAGYEVTFMGASMPPEHLVSYVSDFHVDLVMLGCSVPTNLLQVVLAVDQMKVLGVPVMVGGRAFGSDEVRAKAVGADLFAPDIDAMLKVLATFDPAELVVSPPVSVDPDFWELRSQRSEIAARTLVALTEIWDPLKGYDEHRVQKTRDDIDYALQFLEAAVLTRDVSVWADYLEWLTEVLTSRGLPETVVPAAVEAIRTALGDDLESPLRMLEQTHRAG